MTTQLHDAATPTTTLDVAVEGGLDTTSLRPGPAGIKGRTAATSDADAALRRREAHFAAIRLARSLHDVTVGAPGAVVDFPTTVVANGAVFDLATTAMPGWFAEGHHTVVVKGRIDRVEVLGRFEIGVGCEFGVSPAAWAFTDAASGLPCAGPDDMIAALPVSQEVAVCRHGGQLRRASVAADRARAELIESNRGLVRTVVNRFRGVLRAEGTLLELHDLMIVGEQALLATADRWFTDPTTPPNRNVAWSKLVQRAIGNAVRSEIARATGISVEFRQLLNWFHSRPADRLLPAAEIAQRMAFAAGVTRLMSARGLRDRSAAETLLAEMLAEGTAAYVAPARDTSLRARDLRQSGVFVISSRSSLAEIERARDFDHGQPVRLDGDEDGEQDRHRAIGVLDDGYGRADLADAVRAVIVGARLTPVEAAVWLRRTGVLHPSGHTYELPEIAAECGLADRAEARSALRRAWRKLEQWTATAAPEEIL